MEGHFIQGGPQSEYGRVQVTISRYLHSALHIPLRVPGTQQWFMFQHYNHPESLHRSTRHSSCMNVPCVKVIQPLYAMLRSLILHHFFYYALLSLNSSAAQDACIYRPGESVVKSVVIVKHTIHIITSVPHDTTFQVNTDLTITVDNAPTSLDFLTTYFSKSTAIGTMTGSAIPFNEL